MMENIDPSILWLLGGVVLLLFCSAFFSGSETALMSSSKPKLHKMEKEGDMAAKRARKVTEDPEKLLGTILLGNNLVNIAASALTTGLFIRLFGEAGIATATLVMTFLVLIFAEILPKTMASRAPERHARWISAPMSILIPLLRPFTVFTQFIASILLRLLGVKNANDTNFGEDDVRGAIGMGLEEGVLEKGEHRMLDSVFKLDEMTVEDVMVHRSNITMLDASMNMADVYSYLAVNPSHSRMPVWQDDPDNIIGVLLVKDFHKAYFEAQNTGISLHLKDIMSEPYFVPDSATLETQLSQFRQRRKHMALVVDEYGDLQGLVTLEDILEEIVGEIVDEHDEERVEFTKQADGSVTFVGDYPVRDANREFDWELPEDEDAVTLAGLLTLQHETIPNVGETIHVSGYTMRVVVKKRQRIVKINIKPQSPEGDNTTQDQKES